MDYSEFFPKSTFHHQEPKIKAPPSVEEINQKQAALKSALKSAKERIKKLESDIESRQDYESYLLNHCDVIIGGLSTKKAGE